MVLTSRFVDSLEPGCILKSERTFWVGGVLNSLAGNWKTENRIQKSEFPSICTSASTSFAPKEGYTYSARVSTPEALTYSSSARRRISSRRDSMIVAWHEVPGKASSERTVPE